MQPTINHQARCIFFVDDFLFENISGAKELKVVNTYQDLRKLVYEMFLYFILILSSDLGHEIEAQYW